MNRPTRTGSTLWNSAARTLALRTLDDTDDTGASGKVGNWRSFERSSPCPWPFPWPSPRAGPSTLGRASDAVAPQARGSVGASDVAIGVVPMDFVSPRRWRSQLSPLQCRLRENRSRVLSLFSTLPAAPPPPIPPRDY